MTIDAQILAALRKGNSVSGAELASALSISRAAVWARIEELRSLGYEIEASPHEGYTLRKVPDVLHADDLLSRLHHVTVIGRDFRVFQETTSTNDIAEKLARDGVREGVVIFAESQTKGRGRLGRKWVSPPGKGLWFSILLRPAIPPQSVTWMTIAAATALVRAFRTIPGIKPDIKWPNDILINGKKVAGILTEMSAELDKVRHLILGIGIDVNLEKSDLPAELQQIATSLRIESGHKINRAELAALLVRNLDHDYERVTSGRFAELAEEWEEHCTTVGQEVEIIMGDRTIQGRAEALDADGALLVRTEHGRLERIIGGDVRTRKTT
ncbi:MAG: biotin--[acetyl-CoA-carboxylase] ligase [Verrucomicrobiota bacterium]|nr:biotin--[acetyl-CoA-carboxylase] ligase [Verrucomicrobiota bacterium]